uniref:Uncharacterized protein LOC113796284 n=1 Tax=Dermatophagoides pteronyssinus TaxID=6956 RepID=A0A6P6YA32_DERPT|nr:uncharacterized protein LOC113796284 [Dermatophagoides pteronyssinus]
MLPLIDAQLENEPIIHVIGWEGTRTLLPCNVSLNNHYHNDSIDLILWFRGQEQRALYSIDARRTSTMQRAKHFTGDDMLGSRAFIDLSTRPSSLIIDSVKIDDSGEYRCRVDFRRSPSEHRSILLDVLIPPKEVIIMDEFGQRLNDPITPFNEGAHLNLICEAEGGKPRPLLYWYRNNQLIDDQWTITAQGIVRNELFIPKLQRNDQGSLLSCQSLFNVSNESISEMFETKISSPATTTTMTTTTTNSAIQSSSWNPRDPDQIRQAMLANHLFVGHILDDDNNNNDNNNNSVRQKHKNLFRLKQSQSSILLELNLRPLNVRITTVHRPLIDGQMIVINCESDGARPPALLSWWKSSKRLEHSVTEEIDLTNDNRTLSTIKFLPTMNDNGKILSCRADHPVLPDSSLEDSWILNVLFKPKLTISFGATIQHDNIHEHSNVSIECHILSNPIVTEIGWLFDGKRLSTTFSNTKSTIHHRDWNDSWIEFKSNTLFIFNIDRKHSGRYRCMAANVQGESYSDDILLKVQYRPVCSRGQRNLFGVAQREPLQVPCQVESDPEEVTFRWMFNSSQSESMMMIPIDTFQVRPSSSSSKSRQSIARYEPKTRYGYGQLLCWATNKLGEQLEPCRFDIIPAGQPQSLQNCLIRNQSSDGIIVRCQPGDDGGLDQQFHLEIFQADRGQMIANLTNNNIEIDNGGGENFGQFLFENIFNNNSITDLTDNGIASANPLQSNNQYVEFIVGDIPISTTYVLLLYASNAKGRSNYVTLSATTMSPGSRGSEFLKFTADFGIKPMMYLLITVVIGLVISAIIIMIVSKIRTINRSKGRHRSSTLQLSSKANKSVIKQISNVDYNNDNNNNINLDTFSSAVHSSSPMKLDNHTTNGNDDDNLNLHHPVTLLDLNATNSNIMHQSSSQQQSPFHDDHCLGSLLGANHNSSLNTSLSHHYGTMPINLNHHRHNDESSKHCQQSHHHHPPLNVIIKNPLMEHLSHSSQSPSSIDSLPSQPPPMYHTVYASEQTASTSSADPFFSIHPYHHQSRSESNADDQTTTPLHLLMDVSSYYQHNQDKLSNQSSHTALLPSSSSDHYHNQTIGGSITWSQAETLPLGGGTESRNDIDHSHHHQIGGFLSPTSPISTLSVPFPFNQPSQLELGSTLITMDEQQHLFESSNNDDHHNQQDQQQPTTSSTAV